MSGKDLLGKLFLLLYIWIYRYCYLTGLLVLRTASAAGRVFSLRIRRIEAGIGEGLRHFGNRVSFSFRTLRGRLRRRQRRSQQILASLRASGKSFASGDLKGGVRLFGRAALGCWLQLWPLVRTAVNLALPIAAGLFLYQTIEKFSAQQYALHVQYGSEETGFTDFGYIENEGVYDLARSEVLSKMQGVQTERPIDFSASFSLEPVDGDIELNDQYSLSNRIIAASGADIEEAYGLYIDGQFIDAVRDKSSLLDLLALLQDRYKSSDPTETVSFIRPVAVREGLYPSSRITNLSEVNRQINREVKGEFTYTVEAGDTPSGIASQFDMYTSQLVALNPGILDSLLIGQELLISRAQPFMSVKIQRIEEYQEEIPFGTENVEDASLLKGQTSVIREGEPGLASVRAAVTYVNDIEEERSVISRTVLEDPVSRQVKVGTKLFAQSYGTVGGPTVSSNFIWPVASSRAYVSNGFYGYVGHGGIDIAAPYGAPIIASAPGTVIYSGYTVWGYGRHIIIDHGGGVQTLYGHNSQNVARVGDVVEQGQVIGYVGSTGNSTGNHCHLEIRIGGVQRNPVNYLP
ncbi:MAG: M23 family metallopeptidase [Provencibacterium sp.]|jgi:murein DD-endopeptidase MepM/ murein hydrolase activator NlpD|nr:M23 family metallopeptidase [Provencibacterium sp.]